MLCVENLVAGYGNSQVLKNVSMRVDIGEIVTLLGANGAGKSTTLLTLAGVLQPRSGSIFFGQEKLNGKSPDEILRLGLGLCPEGRRIFPLLTVLENLHAGCILLDTKYEKTMLEKVFDLFPILKDRMYQFGGTLSGGEQQMLAIGRALMSRAKFLMFDEPSLGLAPVIVSKIFQILKEINENGTTILLVEQNAQQALRIAHRGYVMVTGQILFEDSAENLTKSDDVRKAYLGDI